MGLKKTGMIATAFIVALWVSFASAKSTQEVIRIPVLPFMSNYMKLGQMPVVKNNLRIGGQTVTTGYYLRTTTPMVWLFNPKGQPIAWVSSPAELVKLLQHFPSQLKNGAPMMKHAPDLAAQLKLLKQSGAPKLNGPLSGQWAAIFYERPGICRTCTTFLRPLMDVKHDLANKLYLVLVKFTL